MKVLQEGNYVTKDSKGNRTSVPMSQKPKGAEPKARAPGRGIGVGNKANNAAFEAAGMRKGGAVKMKKGGRCR